MTVRETLDNFMSRIREQNPNANWKNLVSGIIILLLVAGFSIWYFDNASSLPNLLQNDYDSFVDETNIPTAEDSNDPATTVVEAGEGLWQVAERVCGDGEAYVSLSIENDISLWQPVEVGQVIKINCGNN